MTILPLTSRGVKKTYPFEVFFGKGVGALPKDSKVKADQIRTIDKRRIVKLIEDLGSKEMEQIDQAVKIHLALS